MSLVQEPCVTDLVRNTSCVRHDLNCLCDNGLASNDVSHCFESYCMPYVEDYLGKAPPFLHYNVGRLFSISSTRPSNHLSTGAQNITANDCGVVNREQPPALKITSISLGTCALVCVVLRLLERPVKRQIWRERIDDLVMLVNAVGQMPILERQARDSQYAGLHSGVHRCWS